MKTARECHVEKKGPLLVALMDVNWKCETLSLSNKEKFGPRPPKWKLSALSSDSLDSPKLSFETAKVTWRWVDPTRSAENASL